MTSQSPMDRVVLYPFQTAELPWLINGGPILTTYEIPAMILQVYQGLLYISPINITKKHVDDD